MNDVTITFGERDKAFVLIGREGNGLDILETYQLLIGDEYDEKVYSPKRVDRMQFLQVTSSEFAYKILNSQLKRKELGKTIGFKVETLNGYRLSEKEGLVETEHLQDISLFEEELNKAMRKLSNGSLFTLDSLAQGVN